MVVIHGEAVIKTIWMGELGLKGADFSSNGRNDVIRQLNVTSKDHF